MPEISNATLDAYIEGGKTRSTKDVTHLIWGEIYQTWKEKWTGHDHLKIEYILERVSR